MTTLELVGTIVGKGMYEGILQEVRLAPFFAKAVLGIERTIGRPTRAGPRAAQVVDAGAEVRRRRVGEYFYFRTGVYNCIDGVFCVNTYRICVSIGPSARNTWGAS